MASNFKVLVHKNSDTLHLKLMGDFDGSSACEILHIMQKKGKKVCKIIEKCEKSICYIKSPFDTAPTF